MSRTSQDRRTQIVLALIGAFSAIAVAFISAIHFWHTDDTPTTVPEAKLDVGKDTATISLPSSSSDLTAEVDAETTARLSVPSSLELYLVRDGSEYPDCPRKHSYRNPQDLETLWTIKMSCVMPLSAGRAHSISAQQVNTNGDALTTKVVAHFSKR